MRYDQFVLGSSEGKKLNDCDLCCTPPPSMNKNTPVSSYDGVTSLCMCSSERERYMFSLGVGQMLYEMHSKVISYDIY